MTPSCASRRPSKHGPDDRGGSHVTNLLERWRQPCGSVRNTVSGICTCWGWEAGSVCSVRMIRRGGGRTYSVSAAAPPPASHAKTMRVRQTRRARRVLHIFSALVACCSSSLIQYASIADHDRGHGPCTDIVASGGC
jgi:hypothetical protein